MKKPNWIYAVIGLSLGIGFVITTLNLMAQPKRHVAPLSTMQTCVSNDPILVDGWARDTRDYRTSDSTADDHLPWTEPANRLM